MTMLAAVRVRAALAAALMPLLAAACGGGGGGKSADSGFGYDQRTEVPALPLPFGLPEPEPAPWTNAYPGLVFDRPIAVAALPDGSDRLVVAEQQGRLVVFADDPGTTVATEFLDLRSRVQFGGEEGLLGLAFHPDYASNGWLYVYYSAGSPRRSVIARFSRAAGDANTIDPGSEVVLLEIPQPFSNHNAGCLQFGPDGMLYVASGDGGSGNDPFDNAQDLTTLLGKVLRLAPDGSIPNDNPFAGGSGGGGSGGGQRGEIWAYGLRNPFRMAFDASGRLWVGDVGQGAFEEIDLVARGQNLGWPLYEGERSNKNPTGVPASAFTPPVWTYGRGDGVAVIGGQVYRGSAVPALVGAYVYADHGSGNVWALVYDGVQVLQDTLLANVPAPASFGEDNAGELLLCCLDGRVRRLVASGAGGGGTATSMPTLLSATGVFASLATLTPVPGILEYGVNTELWADGAQKRRWLALPGPARMQPIGDGQLAFPVGTTLVKHFEFEVAPGVVRRLETRLLLHQIDGWRGYTYRWNDAGTDAELVDAGGADATFAVAMPSDNELHTWRYPSRGECLQCHTAAAGRVLGVTLPQLNRSFVYPRRTADQLGTWQFLGLFTTPIGDPATLPRFVAHDEPVAPLDDRVRCWLDVHCSMCHRPGGPAPVDLDLRYATAGADLRAFGVASVTPPPGGSGVRITAGDHLASDLWLRVGQRGPFGMPPLGSAVVDDAFVLLLAQWIDAGLPPR